MINWFMPDSVVFKTAREARKLAKTLGYKWVAIDGLGDVYAGTNKPEAHCMYSLWIWLNDERPERLGWYDTGIKDWRDLRWEA